MLRSLLNTTSRVDIAGYCKASRELDAEYIRVRPKRLTRAANSRTPYILHGPFTAPSNPIESDLYIHQVVGLTATTRFAPYSSSERIFPKGIVRMSVMPDIMPISYRENQPDAESPTVDRFCAPHLFRHCIPYGLTNSKPWQLPYGFRNQSTGVC